ncbi:MAG: cell division protein ZipA C-terminal FtsZ-binding domain-containing protein [Rugosibacter sp.]
MVLSDLQITLIGAGILGVAAVWVYNQWQERKARRLTEAALTHPTDDTLLKTSAIDHVVINDKPMTEPGNMASPVHFISPAPDFANGAEDSAAIEKGDMPERIEPTLSSLGATNEAAGSVLPSVIEHNVMAQHAESSTLLDMPSVDSSSVASLLVAQPTSTAAVEIAPVAESGVVNTAASDLPIERADPLIDGVIRLYTAKATPAATMSVLMRGCVPPQGKSVRWSAFDEVIGEWIAVDEQTVGWFHQWVGALQLVDRRGAVSERELVHFFEDVQQAAQQINAELSIPDIAPIWAYAGALDQFCATVDYQFTVYIVESAGAAFTGTKLRGVAEASGMLLEADGCFYARGNAGDELFTLVNLGNEGFTADNLRTLATHGLSLTLDVPRVRDGLATFTRMLVTGQQLAKALDGIMVDAQRIRLAEEKTSAIRAKITELQHKMLEADITPGSSRALRLFS